jgi:ribonuclease-3
MGITLEELTWNRADQLNELQKQLGRTFKDASLLQLALVHSSFAFERLTCGRHNETLEFLGDAVLDLAVGHILFLHFPQMREGQLTRIRSALVNESGLADAARRLDLGRHLLLGRGEESSNGREKASILCCAYEALIGAMFLDSGYAAAHDYVQETFGPLIERQGERLCSADAKSRLQERLQEMHNEGPQYILEAEDGPAHARIFTVSVQFRSQQLGAGQASSKKEAEQLAAGAALEFLKERGGQFDAPSGDN